MDNIDIVTEMEWIIKRFTSAVEEYKASKNPIPLIEGIVRSSPTLEKIQEYARHENFIRCLQNHKKWITFRDNNSGLIVTVMQIDWNEKLISWCNTTSDCLHGGTDTFESFMEDFKPIIIEENK